MICYEIGGLGIGFNVQYPIRESLYYEAFRIDRKEYEQLNDKIYFDFRLQKPRIRTLQPVIYEVPGKTIGYDGEWLVRYYHRYPGREYYCSFERDIRTGEGIIWFAPDCLSDLVETSELFDIADVLTQWLRHQTLMLHSSFLIYKNRAILFSGPSGIGKSTQADLWKRELGAKIINGDRSLIRREKDGWKAYGVPNCGSSQISVNGYAPIEGIILLDQGSENTVSVLSKAETYKRLLIQIIMNRYDREECIQTMELVQKLTEEVPVMHLSCRPDVESVHMVKETLEL